MGTPGYKRLSSSTSTYPSALDTSRRVDMDLGLSGGLSARTTTSRLGSDIDREFASLSSSLATDPLLKYNSPLATGSRSAAESTYQAKSYSSTTSSRDGGVPHHSSHSDS